MNDQTLDLSIDVARFYGGLVSNGVPMEAAIRIASAFVMAVVTHSEPDQSPPFLEPWEKE